MKYFVILNPICGRGLGAKSLDAITNRFEEEGVEYTLVQTEGKGHARDLARMAVVDGYDAIVCASGDGTVNEAINGIMDAKREIGKQAAFSVLSVGTGNDFAGGAGIPVGLEPSLDSLFRGSITKIDLGVVSGGDFPEGRYFGNGIGIGFDAAVGIYAEKIRWTRGILAYLIAAIQTVFFYYKPPTLRIELDDQVLEQPCLMVSIMNGTRMGGGFKMAPSSVNNDGLFNLCIAESASKARMFGLIPHFLSGTQEGQKEIKMLQSATAKIKTIKGNFPCHADGEMIGFICEEVEVNLLPGALDLIK